MPACRRLLLTQPPPVWSPSTHSRYPRAFRRACRALLLAARRASAMDLGLSCSAPGLQPPAHLGSLPADVLLQILRQAAFPLSLWVAAGEAAAEQRRAQKPGSASVSFWAPAAAAPAAAPTAPRPAAQPPGMPTDVADAVAAWNAALSSAGSASGSGAATPAQGAGSEEPAVPTPEQLAQGLAGLSFSSHAGPFVFGASG